MDYFESLIRRAKLDLFVILLIDNAVLLGGWWLASKILNLNAVELGALLLVLALIETTLIATSLGSYLMQPVKALWQTILHLSPTSSGIAPPHPETVHFGNELVNNLSAHIYQLVTVAQQTADQERRHSQDISQDFVAQHLPLPLLLLDAAETIKFANQAAADYLGVAVTELIGKNVYMVLDMSFPSEDTFDVWLKDAKGQQATAAKSWERVRLTARDSHPSRLFDLAAYYNKDNPQQIETMLILFDHTSQYSQDDQAISFIALSVHELRTPLTLLRGYIEVFQDELGDNVSPELQDFMTKMQATAEQLTAYVNNMLNVARVDDDQLELQLREEDWSTVLKAALEMVNLRAKVRGIKLECSIRTGLPTVGVDRLSITELLSNLIDNAIKYSGNSKVIKIDAHLTQDGLIETTVQDFGLGISGSIIPNLFTKFYRDHRNRAQVGGTGLGLYLCKAIITAHGGNIWVRSKEGEGSTFGFTLVPYAQLAEELKQSGDQEMVRGAHGWIKNHSLYRR